MCKETANQRQIQVPVPVVPQQVTMGDSSCPFYLGHVDHFCDQLYTMLKQEASSVYTCSDYLAAIADYDTSNPSTTESKSSPPSSSIDATCRVKMTQWCFQVVDYANFKRSTVSLAISLLDRFLSNHKNCPNARKSLLCRKTYQLTCMTCLFMAIKTNEKEDITGNVFSNLSRDAFVSQDLIDMELTILQSLKWRINGPTSFDVLHYVMLALPCLARSGLSEDTLVNIVELSSFQIDLSVGDYYFMLEKRSTVAIAALCNVLEANIARPTSSSSSSTVHAMTSSAAAADLHCSERREDCEILTVEFLQVFRQELKMLTNINVNSIEVEDCRKRLICLFNGNGEIVAQEQQQQQQQSQQQPSQEKPHPNRGKTSTKRTISKVHGESSTTAINSDGPTPRTSSPDCVSRMTKVEKMNSTTNKQSNSSSSSSSSSSTTSKKVQGLLQSHG